MADTNPTSMNAQACTPLEQEVLDEYALLLNNLNKVLISSFSHLHQPDPWPQLKCPLTRRETAVLPTKLPR